MVRSTSLTAVLALLFLGLALTPVATAVSVTPFYPAYYEFHGTADTCEITQRGGVYEVVVTGFIGDFRRNTAAGDFDATFEELDLVAPIGPLKDNLECMPDGDLRFRAWMAGAGFRDLPSYWP
ncbi:MAG: hypothetical protein R3185_04400 [Candidatus Thermoplasmatota archaeon]|nr:hypothetical protein [Candidatus Thermoplasmatota archaeon]